MKREAKSFAGRCRAPFEEEVRAAAVAATSGEDNSGGGDPSMIDARTLAEIESAELERKVMNSEGSLLQPTLLQPKILKSFWVERIALQVALCGQKDGWRVPKDERTFPLQQADGDFLVTAPYARPLERGDGDTTAAAVQSLATELLREQIKTTPPQRMEMRPLKTTSSRRRGHSICCRRRLRPPILVRETLTVIFAVNV